MEITGVKDVDNIILNMKLEMENFDEYRKNYYNNCLYYLPDIVRYFNIYKEWGWVDFTIKTEIRDHQPFIKLLRNYGVVWDT